MSNFLDAAVAHLAVAVSLLAGLAAAFGRELQGGRIPTLRWWCARLLLLPILAIGVLAAAELFELSGTKTALTAAMLALGGYDALRLLERQWRRQLPHTEKKRSDG